SQSHCCCIAPNASSRPNTLHSIFFTHRWTSLTHTHAVKRGLPDNLSGVSALSRSNVGPSTARAVSCIQEFLLLVCADFGRHPYKAAFTFNDLLLRLSTFTMAPKKEKKEVRWKLTVDEYVIRNSLESWTSPLPGASPPPTPIPNPPPPPQPNQDLPLPATLELHRSLTPASAYSSTSPSPLRLPPEPPAHTDMLNEPGAPPPSGRAPPHLAGVYAAELDVVHTPRGQAVTVGDVLTAIQNRVRQYDGGHAPPAAAPYMQRRIATVNGYCAAAGRDGPREAANVEAERAAGPADNSWQVELVVPERYAH
ncbi:hypothetical protein B0H13DRAFT_2510077, partial [Mycena leptocephala]